MQVLAEALLLLPDLEARAAAAAAEAAAAGAARGGRFGMGVVPEGEEDEDGPMGGLPLQWRKAIAAMASPLSMLTM